MRKSNYKLQQVIIGDYVATPIKNAFNDKTAYWLTKAGVMFSLYMFTVEDCFGVKDFEERLTLEGIKPFIIMFEEHLKRPLDNKVYMDEISKANSLEDEKPEFKNRTVVVKKTTKDYVTIGAKTDKEAIKIVSKSYNNVGDDYEVEYSILKKGVY